MMLPLDAWRRSVSRPAASGRTYLDAASSFNMTGGPILAESLRANLAAALEATGWPVEIEHNAQLGALRTYFGPSVQPCSTSSGTTLLGQTYSPETSTPTIPPCSICKLLCVQSSADGVRAVIVQDLTTRSWGSSTPTGSAPSALDHSRRRPRGRHRRQPPRSARSARSVETARRRRCIPTDVAAEIVDPVSSAPCE
jgi:hypothetical protein